VVRRDGQEALDAAIGNSRDGVPMRSDTINVWMSSVKPVTAVAIAQLREQGRLDWDDPVARHIPEFAARDKQSITLRHLLTHTAGLRWAQVDFDGPWDTIIAQLCAAPTEPGWVPGQKAGYHPRTTWYLLAEVVRRVDGRSIDHYAREMIFQPLKMHDSWLGMPREAYDGYGDRIGTMHDTSRHPPEPGVGPDTPEQCAQVAPSANGRGPIRELARLYLALCGDGELAGARVLEPMTVREMISRQRVGMHDLTFNHVMDFGLGFIINSRRYGTDTVPYGYGPHAGESAFGHSGSQSSCAFADAEQRVVVAWVCNGMPGEARHQSRQRALNAAIYQDLGLA
jgi:CubicO group peptidase (beta-lactamase class C family)